MTFIDLGLKSIFVNFWLLFISDYCQEICTKIKIDIFATKKKKINKYFKKMSIENKNIDFQQFCDKSNFWKFIVSELNF